MSVHTATGFQLILTSVHVLMFLALAYLPWINTHNFFAFSFHRLHQSQNSYFHIIKMTLAELERERERPSFLQLCFWKEGIVIPELCMENECLRCIYLFNTKKQDVIINQPTLCTVSCCNSH